MTINGYINLFKRALVRDQLVLLGTQVVSSITIVTILSHYIQDVQILLDTPLFRKLLRTESVL